MENNDIAEKVLILTDDIFADLQKESWLLAISNDDGADNGKQYRQMLTPVKNLIYSNIQIGAIKRAVIYYCVLKQINNKIRENHNTYIQQLLTSMDMIKL